MIGVSLITFYLQSLMNISEFNLIYTFGKTLPKGYVNPSFVPCSPNETSMLRCGFLNGTGIIAASGSGPVLMAGQAYTVAIMIELPESPVNRRLGMFMVLHF
jgi:hypothetical protein